MKRREFTLDARGNHISLGVSTHIMGIINVTPDSFSNDGRLKNTSSLEAHLRYARRLISFGATIIDVGGESTRPGSKPVALKEEIKRVVPLIEALSPKIKAVISVDTSKEEVAQRALDAGASMVNNVQALTMKTSFLKMVRDYNAALVIMHMRGTPANMQKKCQYKDVVSEVIVELKRGIEKCLEIGIKKDRIIIDPGIGFAKTAQQNLEILNRLSEFQQLPYPIAIGTSRKSFIGKILDKDVDDRLMGTAASGAVSIIQGAHILRVHDVKPMTEVARITDAILNVDC